MVLVGYMTASTKKEAKDIALALLEEGLIACANILPGVESYFVWEEALQKTSEVVVVMKTRTANTEAIVNLVKDLHSYEAPCVVFMPVEDGNPAFLRWVEESC